MTGNCPRRACPDRSPLPTLPRKQGRVGRARVGRSHGLASSGGRLMLAMVGCAAVAMATPAPAQRAGVEPPVRIVVEAKSIETFSARAPEQQRFGMVEYLG